jgi:hypothetical protein
MAKKETVTPQDRIANVTFEFSGSSSRKAFARAAQQDADASNGAAMVTYQAVEFMGRFMQVLINDDNASPTKAHRIAAKAATDAFKDVDMSTVDSLLTLHWAGAHDKITRAALAPTVTVPAAVAHESEGREPA